MKYRFVCLCVLFGSLCLALNAEVIKHIQVVGNIQVETEVIKARLDDFTLGNDISETQLNYAVKKLYSTNLFSNVEINVQGDKLIINVKENPAVDRFTIVGNSAVSKEKIEEVIQLKSHVLFTEDKLQSDILAIIKLYNENGIVDVLVKPYKEEVEAGKIALLYQIEEGKKLKIRKISFVGNETFVDGELKSNLLSTEYRFYNFLSSSHYYVYDRVVLDGSVLRNFYFSHGFLDFKIESTVTEFDGAGVEINFIVNEGKTYTVKKTEVLSDLAELNVDDIEKIVEISPGDVFNINAVNRGVSEITEFLHNRGYFFAVVEPLYIPVGHEVTVQYKITEGNKAYINRINIKGNERTLDHVIRRELDISEQDPYNLTLVERSRYNLIHLGFFDGVDINPIRSGDNEVDLDIELQERNTGFATAGGGYGSNVGFVGNLSVSEGNFLGTGNRLAFSLERSSPDLNTSISFTRPYTFGLPISSGLDLLHVSSNNQDNQAYRSSTHSATLRLSQKLSSYFRNEVKYSYKRIDVYDVKSDSSSSIEEGVSNTSLLGYALVYDSRNTPMMPNKGILLKAGQDFAGVGGDVHYLSSIASATLIASPKHHPRIVFYGVLKGGYIFSYKDGEDVGVAQRFFMGSDEVRGFKPSGIGPRDTKSGDSLGGKLRVMGTLQVDFPLFGLLPEDLPIKGSLFVDAGTLTGLDGDLTDVVDSGRLRASIGYGLSWVSPIGVLRCDFGYPILKDEHDKTQVFRFQVGSNF